MLALSLVSPFYSVQDPQPKNEAATSSMGLPTLLTQHMNSLTDNPHGFVSKEILDVSDCQAVESQGFW